MSIAALISKSASSVNLGDSIAFIRSDETRSSANSVECKHLYAGCLRGMRSFFSRCTIRRRATAFASNLLMTDRLDTGRKLDISLGSGFGFFRVYEMPWASSGLSHPWLTCRRRYLSLERVRSCNLQQPGRNKIQLACFWWGIVNELFHFCNHYRRKRVEWRSVCHLVRWRRSSRCRIANIFKLFWRKIPQTHSPTECAKCCFSYFW